MDIQDLLSEAIAEAIKSDPKMAEYRDWTYRDLPRMTTECLEKLKLLIGEENIKWITYADYGDSVHGQILISPVGMQNLSDFQTATRQ